MTAIPLSGVGGAPFGVGAAISKSLSIFGKGWWKFFILTLIPLSPYYIYELATQPTTLEGIMAQQAQTASYFTGLGLRTTFAIALQSLANVTCLYGAYQIMRGQDFSIGESLSAGLGRLLPALGTSLSVVCLFMLSFVLLFVLWRLLPSLGTSLSAIVLFMIGFVLLFVPGFIVLLMMYVALPVCVVERLGPFASMSRSRFLTKGSRWKLLGLTILMYAAILVLGGIFTGIGWYLAGFMGYRIGAMPVSILVYAFFSVLAAVVYHDLRVSKEGVDVETLAGVFD